MKKQNFGHIALLLLTCMLTACFSNESNKNQDFVFSGDPKAFVLQLDEVPVGWNLRRAGYDTVTEIPNYGVVYEPTNPDEYTQSTITHGVDVFEDVVTTDERFREFYDYELARRGDRLLELPEVYSYTSPVADDFYIFYSKNDSFGPVMGYNYEVSARYGNVAYDIRFVIEGVEPTDIKASEANILTWAEVEGMLKLIDEKFVKAGF